MVKCQSNDFVRLFQLRFVMVTTTIILKLGSIFYNSKSSPYRVTDMSDHIVELCSINEWEWLQRWLMAIIKNSYFLTNFNEIFPKCSNGELVKQTKFHRNWSKIVDFSQVTYLEANLRNSCWQLYISKQIFELIDEDKKFLAHNQKFFQL